MVVSSEIASAYGVYLWHWPIFLVFGPRVGIPLSLALATLSYRLIGQPFLRLKPSRQARFARPLETQMRILSPAG